MKNMALVLERLKKCGVEGIESILTLQDGLDILAKNTIKGGKKEIALFKKFAIYDSEYVRTELPFFYHLIEEEVESKEEAKILKAKQKQGLTEEEAKAEIERTKLLNDLGENRIIGYARVSTADQNLTRQLVALKEAGCQVIFQEKKSGKNTDRIEYKAMMNSVKAGDTIIVSELTRIARSTTDLFKIMAELEERGVQVKSLKESWLDTTTAHGRLMFTIMAGLSQFERELLLERQSEGIKVAKDNGVKFGKKLNEKADIDLAIALYKEGKYTTTQIADMTNISRTTLWRRLKNLGLLK